MVGRTVKVLLDGINRDGGALTARTSGNRLVSVKADPGFIGSFRDVRITSASTWSLTGELIHSEAD